MSELRERTRRHLDVLYPGAVDDRLVSSVLAAVGIDDEEAPSPGARFSASETILITYGDSLIASAGSPALPPLAVLEGFLGAYLADVIETVHILPFFPASSDGGFSVIDHRAMEPALGTWNDLERLGHRFSIMADLIVNHGSSQSEWFRQFLAGEAPGRDDFVTVAPDSDVSTVTRPRTHPLLQRFETADGPRWVWCTFSRDQVDFDLSNPDVLVEFCRVIDELVRRGVKRLRLDAIVYAWKRPGTASIHLPQTHELVKLVRTLASVRAPDLLLVTETNVPHEENVSYFGDGDEAHVVYNFSLVPLVFHTLLSGDATALTTWAGSTAAPAPGSAFLNFLASHDGIGLRPAEGLLTDEEILALVRAAEAVGGRASYYTAGDSERAYELNVSSADLLAGPDRSRIDRFIAAHAIVLAFRGVPAFYIHTLLSTAGDFATRDRTGHNRDINRARLDWPALQAELSDASTARAEILARFNTIIGVRRRQPAFHPDATQEIFDLGPDLFALRRVSVDGAQVIVALQSVTDRPTVVDMAAMLRVDDVRRPASAEEARLVDVVSGRIVKIGEPLSLAPYETLWLSDPT